MKVLKISLLLILSFSIVSCSQDDEPQEPIVDNPIARNGEWIPYQSVKVYEDDSEVITEFINCEGEAALSSFIYFRNHIEKNYFHNINQYNIEDENCFFYFASGNWNQTSDNFDYQMILDTFYDFNGDYITREPDTLNFHVKFITNDTIEIYHKDELEDLKTEEPNLVDFYRKYSYKPYR